MRSRRIFILIVVAFVMAGCATTKMYPLVTVPEPPMDWNASFQKKIGCPDITGEYRLIPDVATLQDKGIWGFSVGQWFDFSLLVSFRGAGVQEWKPNEKSGTNFSKNVVLKSNVQDSTVQVISPIKNADYSVEHTIRESEGDYTCELGVLIFPEFHISGGTEGASLNGRIYRSATKTLAGDLLFYEQIQGQETVHKYYMFRQQGQE